MNEPEQSSELESELTVLRARAELLEVALQDAKKAASQNIIQAELQVEALKSGILDLDGLKLIDAGDLPVDEKGGLKNAAAAIAKLRRQKPWLFNGSSSSAHASAPPTEAQRQKRATDMTLEEWREARTDLLRRR